MYIPYNIYYYQDGIYGYKEKEMKKKYIKPETETIKVDSESFMVTSQHKEGEGWFCPCEEVNKDSNTNYLPIDKITNKLNNGK